MFLNFLKLKYLVGIVGIGIFLYFLYYTISPLFITTEVYESVPTNVDDKVSGPIKYATVIGTTAHPASGNVRIIESENKKYIRYENFKTINGPDIYVYLSKDLDAKDFISLGKVRATEGDINYEVPEDVSISDYQYVLIWCKAFGVLFNYADIRFLSV